MAEEGDAYEEDGPDDSAYREDKVRRKIDKENQQRKENCRPRIDILAMPNRRLILDLYKNHADHLDSQRVERIKKILQELYAMTPEETRQYFAHLNYESKKRAQERELKSHLRKLVRRRNRRRQRAKAYKLFEKLLKRGFEYSFHHPVPPLVSVRLRNLSDMVLEQICDLRNLQIPKREDPDQIGLLLIAISDWLAIAIEHLYYNVQLKKNKELEEIEAEEELKRQNAAKALKVQKGSKIKEVQSQEVRVEELGGMNDTEVSTENDKDEILTEVE